MLGSMPWPIRDLLTMKQELVEFALRPGVNRRELFSRYGISAPCAYKWLKRYQSKGVECLAEHSVGSVFLCARRFSFSYSLAEIVKVFVFGLFVFWPCREAPSRSA